MKWIEPIVISLAIVVVLLYLAGPRLVSSALSDIQGRDLVAPISKLWFGGGQGEVRETSFYV